MKGGIVATIRINPEDCQSVLDVMEKAGVTTRGMSFAAMASLAMSSLLNAARQDGIIPTPDPFQYLNRLQPYIKAKHGRKLAITEALHNEGARLKAPPITASLTDAEPEAAGPSAVSSQTAPQAQGYSTEEIREAAVRLTELLNLKDAADEGAPGVTWTAQNEEEFLKVYAIVYPDG
jgi:hypothetical protein